MDRGEAAIVRYECEQADAVVEPSPSRALRRDRSHHPKGPKHESKEGGERRWVGMRRWGGGLEKGKGGGICESLYHRRLEYARMRELAADVVGAPLCGGG